MVLTKNEGSKKRHMSFEKWHKHNLIKLLEFLEFNFEETFLDMLDSYDEWLMGN